MSWSLCESTASLTDSVLSLTIDIARPWQGMRIRHVPKDADVGVLPLGFSPEPTVAPGEERILEAYVRDSDLVVSYDELETRDVRPKACWRDLRADVGVLAIELSLSTQTLWLDSRPQIQLSTRIDEKAEVLQFLDSRWQPMPLAGPSRRMIASDGLFLVRPHQFEFSYAELVFPTDFHGAQLDDCDNGAVLKYGFFPGSLEKGVVQVGRVWSAWLDASQDTEQAQQIYERLCRSPLPLTS